MKKTAKSAELRALEKQLAQLLPKVSPAEQRAIREENKASRAFQKAAKEFLNLRVAAPDNQFDVDLAVQDIEAALAEVIEEFRTEEAELLAETIEQQDGKR
jgi:hypothetical protein